MVAIVILMNNNSNSKLNMCQNKVVSNSNMISRKNMAKKYIMTLMVMNIILSNIMMKKFHNKNNNFSKKRANINLKLKCSRNHIDKSHISHRNLKNKNTLKHQCQHSLENLFQKLNINQKSSQ